MIKEAPIVRDTRKIRCIISKKFDDDFVRYIDYLISEQSKTESKKSSVHKNRNEIAHPEVIEKSHT